jgi:(p)ppGpp synthase/HD superfamily hydrolase
VKNKAKEFAIIAHGDQKYGEHPYSVHVDEVAHIASEYGELDEAVAFLHDVVEDTETTEEGRRNKRYLWASSCELRFNIK